MISFDYYLDLNKRNCYCENDSKKISGTVSLTEPNCMHQCPGNSSELCGFDFKIRFDILKCKFHRKLITFHA
jgi:hypothetical protein